jgi:predicted Zn-dependent peptidase
MKVKTAKSKTKIARLFVGFKSGSSVETKTRFPSGIAHMLEHMIFKGTPTRTADEINKSFAKLGARVNASTSHRMIIFEMCVLEENLDSSMEIFSDIIKNANLPEAEFEKERNVVLEEEMSYRDSIQSFMFESIMKKCSDSYLSHPIIGTESSIRSFSREDAVKFKERFCKIDQAYIFLSSSMKNSDAKAVIEKYFGKASGRVKSPMKFEDMHLKNFGRHFVQKDGLENYYIEIAYPGFKTNTDESIKSGILCSILSGGMESRLMKRVREENGLVYGIHASHFATQIGGLFLISFDCGKENVDKVIDLVDDELSKLLSEGISQEEIENFRVKAKFSLCLKEEDPFSSVNNQYKMFMHQLPSFEENYNKISNFSKEDISEIASSIVSNDRYVFVFGKEEL